MNSEAALREAGELQSRLCRDNGSPTYSAIIDKIVRGLNGHGEIAELLRGEPRDPVGSALYLRLLGSVHRLVLADEANPLRAYFPSVGGVANPEKAVPVFFDVVESQVDAVVSGMAAEIQTNEVGRSAPLSAGLNFVGTRSGRRLRLLEVGASAGLNLWPDRYRVDAGAVSWGPPDSALVLANHFVAGTPPATGFEVVDRQGCDTNPLDIADSDVRNLLRSFVWPEHVGRFRRLDAALSTAEPVELAASSAEDWLARQLQGLASGVTTVVFHSIVWPYLTDEQRTVVTKLINEAGGRADDHHRLAWLTLEPTKTYDEVQLSCRRWPERECTLLAISSPHGRQVRWLQ